MKKFLVLTFALLLAGVSIASASTLKMSGDYYVKGTWYDNQNGEGIAEPIESYGQYDHEMTLDMTFAMTPYTKVAARLELRDEIWGVSGGATEGAIASTVSGTSATANQSNENNIYVEELYGQHTFMNRGTVKVGLMKTSTWSTDFDNGNFEAFRVQYILPPTPLGGTLFVYSEKYQPSYALGGKETLGTDADTDAYVAGWATKIGSVMVLPLFAYIDAEGSDPANGGALDFSLLKADLGFSGVINNVGWEAEILYVDYNYDVEIAAMPSVAGDYAIWGAHLHAWTQLDALKLGGYVTYASYDEDVDKGFGFGSEYDGGSDSLMPGRTMLLNDEVDFGPAGGTAIDSASLGALYGTYTINEKASVTLFGCYVNSNVENAGTIWDGATAYEVNVIGEYKITPLLKYSAGAAMAQVEYGNGTTDPQEAIEISHKLAFTF